MQFNFGAGLSKMGASIADTAGKASLEMQKAGLEEDKVRLANQLAETSASKGRAEEHGFRMEEAQKASDISVAAHLTNAENDAKVALTQVPLLAKAHQDAIDQVVNSPEALKNLNAYSLATQPEAKAKIAEAMATTAVNNFNLSVAKTKNDAQTAYADAQKSGDPEAIRTARANLDALSYTPGQAAQAATVAEGVARLAATEVTKAKGILSGLLERSKAKNMTPEVKKALEGEIASQQATIKDLEDNSSDLVRDAVRAARSMPGSTYNSGNAPAKGTPDVGSLLFGSPGATTPAFSFGSGGGPAPLTLPGGGP